MNPTAPISLFDVDRTLTRAPTYSRFLLSSAWRTSPFRLLLVPLLFPVALLHVAKLLTRRQMKTAIHGVLLGRRLPRAAAVALGKAFAQRVYADGLYSAAHQRIREEHRAGRRVILATAAPELYVRPLADLLGIRDIVATRCRWEDDHLTATIDGENCYGRSKRDMLSAFLERQGIARDAVHIRFFSDHASDLPTFDWADGAIVVNPCQRLAQIARARDWPQQDWRVADMDGAVRGGR